jgi:type II secretory pathway pseudopilin PulG
MSLPSLRAKLTATRDDSGFTLVAVIGTMAMLMLFVLGSLAFVLQQMPANRADQDAKTAMAAAQAGIDEYLSRLNVDDTYWVKGNNDPSNPAFTTAGRDVPGTNGEAAKFKYQVLSDSSVTARTGVIRLQVTGISSPNNDGRVVSRTLTTELRPRGFLRFIYFTDVEGQDTDLYRNAGYGHEDNGNYEIVRYHGDYYYILADPSRVDQDCAQYYYAGRSDVRYNTGNSRPFYLNDGYRTYGPFDDNGYTVKNYCAEIQFTSGDVIDGPLHTNDALQIQGSSWFKDPVTETSWSNPPNSNKRWWGNGTPSSGSGGVPGYRPVYAPRLDLPVGNEELLKYVKPKVDTSPNTDRPGCLYTGATRITFLSNGTMKVLSPGTTSNVPGCYNGSTSSLRKTEQTVALPPMIYVNPTSNSCSDVGYPMSNESTTRGAGPNYDCKRGTAFVEGTVKGQVTVAAKDDIVITDDLVYANDGSDTNVTGLVAGNYVWVYHPVKSNGDNLLSSSNSVHNIHAAILSLRHSFLVQNWDQGDPLSTSSSTKLNVVGAIAQKFRGPVGTGNGSTAVSGYLKNYVYDSRLLTLQPPYFLKPVSSPWQAAKYTDK